MACLKYILWLEGMKDKVLHLFSVWNVLCDSDLWNWWHWIQFVLQLHLCVWNSGWTLCLIVWVTIWVTQFDPILIHNSLSVFLIGLHGWQLWQSQVESVNWVLDWRHNGGHFVVILHHLDTSKFCCFLFFFASVHWISASHVLAEIKDYIDNSYLSLINWSLFINSELDRHNGWFVCN